MAGLLGHFEKELRERGLRVTAERRTILAHAFEHFGHFCPDELVESLNRHGHGVSRATVYRTLAHLVETGFLRRHELGGRRTIYEPNFGRMHHEHMVCVECGRILEFVEDRIERLQDEVCERYGFRPVSHTLQIHGVCKACHLREAAAS
jgi:Fur family ferric uptake transcriptional regulator